MFLAICFKKYIDIKFYFYYPLMNIEVEQKALFFNLRQFHKGTVL